MNDVPHPSPRPSSSLSLSLARLTRWRLSLAVAGAAGFGMLLHDGRPDWLLLPTVVGVALLAAAGSAGNQLQERDLDACMLRTCGRPLPRGDLGTVSAAAIALVLAAGGIALLLSVAAIPALLGLAALFCYNGLYTPLKRRTPLALLPGALCGALPPLIGWSAAGGALGDFHIVLVATLFYLWQLPHFWRLAEKHAADYRRAGLPLLQDQFPPHFFRLARQSWTLATACAALLLPLYGLLQTSWTRGMLPAAVLLLALSSRLRRSTDAAGPAWADLGMVLLVLLLLGDRLLTTGDLLPGAHPLTFWLATAG